MSQFPRLGVGLGVMGGGAVLSALGSLFGAQSQNRAGRQARDRYGVETARAMALALSSLFGGNGLEMARGMMDPGIYERLVRESPELAQGPTGGGGGYLAERSALADQVGSRQRADLDYFDRDTKRLAGEEKRHDTALSDLFGEGGSAAGGIRRAFNPAMQLASGAEGIARQYGSGREAQIERDVGRARTSAEQQMSARLAASGLGGSTIAANMLSGNTRRFAETEQDAKTSLGESVTDRVLAARGQRTGIAGGQASALSQLFGTGAGMRASAGQGALQRGYQRSSDRMGLSQQQLGRDIAMREVPIEQRLRMMTSSLFNPFAGVNTAQFYPGASGVGGALGTLGGAAGATGSYITGANLQEQLMRLFGTGAGRWGGGGGAGRGFSSNPAQFFGPG